MKKIKILFIHHGTGIGGAPISLLNLIRQLDSTKFDCKVAFIKGGVAVDLFKKEGINTEIINSSNVWFSHNESGKIQWRYFYKYFRIYKHWLKVANYDAPNYLREQDFDILHLNSHVLSSWAVAGKKMGKKIVLHNREAVSKGYFGIRYKILKILIEKSCDIIINISKDNYNRLGIKNKAVVIYNFVNMPLFFRPSMKEKRDKFKILYLGGMAKIKGFDTVVACLSYLNPEIVIQVAGNLGRWEAPKTIKDKITQMIKLTIFRKTYKPLQQLFTARNVEILGLLKNPLPYIDECDVLISPFKIEHFSRPAVEAFAYGKPVIGSDVEGMAEIIDHGVNGLLVEKDNPEALAKAINYLCKYPDKAREMGLKGREKAEKIFSPEINTKKVEQIYDQLMI